MCFLCVCVTHHHIPQFIASRPPACHGTHVSSIIAGSHHLPHHELNRYSGVAPAARIAFLDIERDTGGSDGLFAPPADLVKGVYQPLYDQVGLGFRVGFKH